VGHPLKNNIVTLDKRDYRPKNADDSDGEPTPSDLQSSSSYVSEEQKYDMMTQKIVPTGVTHLGKKKSFGVQPEDPKKH
jgi:hypothetical protein